MNGLKNRVLLSAVGSVVMAAAMAATAGAAGGLPSNGAAQRATLDGYRQASLGKPAQQVYDDAVAAFRVGRYPTAYGRFAALADAGHVPSAQAALFMLRHGVLLFGSAWSASEDQATYWNALVINNARAGVASLAWQVSE